METLKKTDAQEYIKLSLIGLFYAEKNKDTKAIENIKKHLSDVDFNFYKPTKDSTGKIFLMKYCNNGFSYGIEVENEKVYFHLCKSPLLDTSILSIHSTHQSTEELRSEFLKQKQL